MKEEIGTEYDEDQESGPAGGHGAGGKVAIIGLILLMLMAAGTTVFFGLRWSATRQEMLEVKTEATVLRAQVEDLETAKADLAGQLSDKQTEFERQRSEWEEERKQMEIELREKVQRTYAQMNEIVYDSRKTLEYIGSVEDRLKAGKALDLEESKQLESVINGLDFLHQQYSKPIHEFRELERFLSEQLATPAAIPPRERTGLFRRIFSKDYKREQEAFFKEAGQREAFERARFKVSEAYNKAQSEMKALSLDSGEYLDQLAQVVQSNKASAEMVDEFFDKSKEILKIHDRIMSIEPEEELRQVKP